MKLAFTLAVGTPHFGQCALNWCLSVKNANPKAKTALIYTASAVSGIEPYIDAYFDYTLQMPDEKNPIEQAFRLKTELYDIVTQLVPEAESYLFMDADTIMLSGRSVDEFFEELKDVDFTMWCNDVYDFATKTRMRDDYTFWCEPEDLKTYFEGGLMNCKMPQVNSSFIYFKKDKIKHGKISAIFFSARTAYQNQHLPHKKYKGVMPDEFCFNLALTQHSILPHQIPYYPIFFSFASEHFEEQYIRNWKAIGFAGEKMQHDSVVHLYNHNVAYFRELFGVEEKFKIPLHRDSISKDFDAIFIEPITKRTLFRRDEVENSGGGIFNPDGYFINGKFVTIFRKEKNHDFYLVGHNQETALAHITTLSKNAEESFELTLVGKEEDERFEDFRVVGGSETADGFWVSHSVVKNNFLPQMTIKVGLSYVSLVDKTLSFSEVISMPIEGSRFEKNWVFFVEDGCWYCIYSISPYMIFALKKEWEQVSVFQPEIDWFHKDVMICNSTKPLLVCDEYLMLFHTKEGGIFFQGAIIINKRTKEITHYTKRPITIKKYAEGFQSGLIYVSGILYVEEKNLLRIFFGEADSHSCSNDYNADEFVAMVKENAVDESNNNSVLQLLKQTKL